ncbi:MAG: putative rane protein [Clostridia bacterium]|jgi:hypothetical protein|nr:putative rane protein [Clostridia bacterium]
MLKENIRQLIKQNLKVFFVTIALIGIATLLFYVSDIKCIVKYTIGIPCPGCGLTRAWLSFLKMDFKAAFGWHPLFWIVPFVVIIGVFLKGRIFKDNHSNRMFWIILVAIVVGVYSIRMIRLFPDHPPMDYNKQSFLYKWVISKTL